MTVVYLDRVVLLNLAVDYLLLLATARLAGLPLRRGRLALAAALLTQLGDTLATIAVQRERCEGEAK